jgi:hypothetical protein
MKIPLADLASRRAVKRDLGRRQILLNIQKLEVKLARAQRLVDALKASLEAQRADADWTHPADRIVVAAQ